MTTNKNITTTNKNQFSLEPQDFNQLMTFADIVSKSGMIPKDYIQKPGNIVVAVQMGVEIGLKPMQSLQNISVINGRPSLWGDALIALVKNSPVCEYIKESFSSDGKVAYCEVKRKDEKEPHIRSFSLEDARIAGLLEKDNWKKYPKRMIQLRARAWALRDVFPDVLLGMQVTEEMEDFVYTQNQTLKSKVEAAPQTLEQMGLSTSQKDGKLIVEGNTYGKNEMLKNLGFRYENKVWCMDLPITESDVIETEHIKETQTTSQEDVNTNNTTPQQNTEEHKTIKIPEIANIAVLEKFLTEIGLEFERKVEGEKTWLLVTTEDITSSRDILKELKFKNTKTRGICKDITSLIPTEPDVVYEEIQETNEVKVATNTNNSTPFDEVVVEEINSNEVQQKELPFD